MVEEGQRFKYLSSTVRMFPRNRSNSQELETFKTEVHVPPGSHIEFELHYQEMMERKLGLYEHSLHLQPGRLVPQFQVRTSGEPHARTPRVFVQSRCPSTGGRLHL